MNSNSDSETSTAARQHHLTVQSGQRVVDALKLVESDAALLQEAAKKGAVWIRRMKPNGQLTKLVRVRELDEEVLFGSEVFANIDPSVLAKSVAQPELLEAHKNYSFWFKPRGVLSQGSKWGDHTSVTELVAQIADKPAHLVHRLDKDACGIMVIAHTRPAVRELTALFAKRQVTKRYQVLVNGEWTHPVPYRCDGALDEQSALTEIERFELGTNGQQSTLTIRLHTGRKHQIRRHLESLKLPVIGDRRYGEDTSGKRLALMATQLEFVCPFSKAAIQCGVTPKHLSQL